MSCGQVQAPINDCVTFQCVMLLGPRKFRRLSCRQLAKCIIIFVMKQLPYLNAKMIVNRVISEGSRTDLRIKVSSCLRELEIRFSREVQLNTMRNTDWKDSC